MSVSLVPVAAICGILALTGEAPAQESAPACNPRRGAASARIECLTRLLHSLDEKVSSLQAELKAAYLPRAELDSALDGYVKYKSPLAINLLIEPSLSQVDGRCLEAYAGEAAVIAHRPCNFDTKLGLKWQLLPAPRTAAENR
jgi:hypothetical protein